MTGLPAFRKATMEVRWPQPDVALVVLAGEHDLYSEDELRERFEQALARCDHLIVDLSAAEFIDSTITANVVGEDLGTVSHRIAQALKRAGAAPPKVTGSVRGPRTWPPDQVTAAGSDSSKSG